MSTAPAVPTAQRQTAPTTVVDSTDSAPHGQSISAIGHEGAGPEEAMLHSGAFNTVDMYLRMQFIALSSFIWNTNQAPGTLLWSSTITPLKNNQFLRHLAKMYNIWVGGFDYNVKICGTGFHAGALAVVRLPPNIRPETVTSPADFTAFEYKIIDPKTLEIVTHHVIDQRRVMYHYLTDTGTDSIGGFVAIYVLDQLNTSSTGSQSIVVQTLSRPSQDFNFFQVRPITGDTPTPQPDEPKGLADALAVTDLCAESTATFAEKINNFVVIPVAQADPLASQGGCFKFNGDAINSKLPDIFPLKSLLKTIVTVTKVTDNSSSYKVTAFEKLPISASCQLQLLIEDGRYYKPYTLTNMTDIGTWLGVGATEQTKATCYAILSKWYEEKQVVPQKPADESFFVFDNHLQEGDQLRYSYQTRALAKLLQNKDYLTLMTPQDAAILDMYDSELDVPIRRIKLYYNGHITTKGSTDQITLKALKYYFKFVQISRASEPIPAPPKKYLHDEKFSLWTHSTQKQ